MMNNKNSGRHIAATTLWTLVAIVAVVTLVAIVGMRLGETALAIIAGAVVGVLAAIPTSLVIIYVTRRAQRPARPAPMYHPTPQPEYPPVVVISPQQQPIGPYYPPQPQQPRLPEERTFTIVGEQ
jgi:hypothetical protein